MKKNTILAIIVFGLYLIYFNISEDPKVEFDEVIDIIDDILDQQQEGNLT